MEPIVSSTVYEVDHILQRLARVQGALVVSSARLSAHVVDASVWTRFGYRNSNDFARERLDRSGRWLRRLAALQRAVERCPQLAAALRGADGGPRLSRAAAFEIVAVVTPHTAPRWIRRARELSVRELRAAVRKARQTDPPKRPDGTADQGTHATGERDGCDSSSSVTSIRLSAPPEVQLAFQETLELHRAVAGSNVGVSDFLESLVGEAATRGWTVGDDERSSAPATVSEASKRERKHLEPLAPSEIRRRRALLKRRSGVAQPSSSNLELNRALKTLNQLEVVLSHTAAGRSETTDERSTSRCPSHAARTQEAARPSGVAALRALRVLNRLEHEIEVRAAELLLELSARAPWRALGYRGVGEYAEERWGWSATTTYRRVRLARKLRSLPDLRGAYDARRVGVEAALWAARNIGRDEAAAGLRVPRENAWVEHAQATTVKRLRDEERLLQRQDLLARAAIAQQLTKSSARARGTNGTHLPFDPSGRRCPTSDEIAEIPSDAAWFASIVRAPGQTRHAVCELGCNLLERIRLKGALASQPWNLVASEDRAMEFVACVESARRDLSARASELGCESAASDARLTPVERIAREMVAREERIPRWLAVLALLEEYVATWDDPRTMNRRPLDAIHSRDGWRCGAPGCTARRNLQIHHIEHRARGGGDDPSNLHDVCAFHHLRGEHGDLARCQGRAPLDVVWRLGTLELGVWYRNERRIPPPA